MIDLGPMGTATADSLREVGLEPPAPAPPPTPGVTARPPAPLVLRPAPPFGRVLACAAALAGAGGAGSTLLQVQRARAGEIEHETQRYLQALYEMEHVTERRLEEVEHGERELAAEVRRMNAALRARRKTKDGRQ